MSKLLPKARPGICKIKNLMGIPATNQRSAPVLGLIDRWMARQGIHSQVGMLLGDVVRESDGAVVRLSWLEGLCTWRWPVVVG